MATDGQIEKDRRAGARSIGALLLDPAVRRKLGGQLVSAAVHALILLLLASITLSSGEGSGFGLPGFRGPRISLGARRPADLSDLVEKVPNEPRKVADSRKEELKLPDLPSLLPSAGEVQPSSVKTWYEVPGGGLSGIGGSFGLFIGGLRRRGLDVALVIDATGSMQNAIAEIKEGMIELVDDIQRLVPTARVGAVAFRDRGEEFVVRWSDLSFHGNKTKAFLAQIKAEGGGDWEEAVAAGLETAVTELRWRKRAKRVIVLVGSSPPHKETMPDILRMVGDFRRAGGIVSTIDVTQRLHEEYERKLQTWLYGEGPSEISPLPEFYREVQRTYREIAGVGGGEMAGLGWKSKLTNEILVFAFGSRWRAELAKFTGG